MDQSLSADGERVQEGGAMTIDKGNRVERASRGMFVCAFALACGACGSDRHSPHDDSSAGNASAGDSASLGGDGSLGGNTNSGGRAASGGDVSDGGDGGENGDMSHAGEGGDVSGGGASEGGSSGHAGTGPIGETAGGAGIQSGGAGSGGMSSGGANSAGSNAGGMDAVGGTGGASFGGENTAGGANTAGTSSGGVESAGGSNSAGNNTGGMDALGGTSPGGTNSGGMDASGGTNSAGTNSAGSNSGGAPASCGDALLAASEECDDGNALNLDGCSASCRYEVVDRMTSISLQRVSAPASCAPTTNALGKAFGSIAAALINDQLKQSISAGSLNNLMHFGDLEDPTGASDDSSLTVGVLPAFPDAANGTWPGGTPLDFWFRVPSASVNAQGVPLSSLPGSLTARALSVGPGLLQLPLTLGGAPSTFSVTNARLLATLDATPEPNVPAPPPTNLAPGLTVFRTITGSGSGQGICGNVTVESLAHIPVPASLASGAQTPCMACAGSHAYTACTGTTVEPGCNSMLDVLVGGCKTASCFLTVVTATQPDVPAPGSASVSPLSLGSGNAVPSDQIVGNNAAYSSYFKFDANRAHITGVQ